MVKCPNCSQVLEPKIGTKKLCAQIGNPDIAIVETQDPHFCNGCKEYYLKTNQVVSAVLQVKDSLQTKRTIEKGIYS